MPTDPEKKRAYAKAYYAANKARMQARKKAYGPLYKAQAIARTKAWQAAHPEEYRALQQAYRATNAERLRTRRQADQAAHPEKNRAGVARYRMTHPERYRAIQKAYYAKHRQRIRARVNGYRATNATYLPNQRLYMRVWRQANPDKVRAIGASRRARKARSPRNDLTAAQWKAIKAHYDHRCVYCGTPSQRLTQDHIVPLAKGGAHTVHNVVPACRSCNSKKGTGHVLRPIQPLLLVGD